MPIVNGINRRREVWRIVGRSPMRAFQKFDPAADRSTAGFAAPRLLNLLKLLNRLSVGALAALATLAGALRRLAIPGRLRIGSPTSTNEPRSASTWAG